MLLALILIVGCEKDSLPIEEAEMLTIDEKIEKQFTMDAFEDPSGSIKDNLEINWQNFSEKEIDSTLWREYDAKEIIPFSVSSKLITATRYMVLVTIEDDNNFVYLIAKLASFDSAENYSYFNLNKYSGMVYIMGMDGKTQVMQTYKKGEMIGNVLDIDKVSIKNLPVSARTCMERGTAYARTYDCPDSLSCAYQVGSIDSGGCGGAGGTGGSGGYVAVTSYYFTDWYNYRGGGVWEYQSTQYQGSNTEYVWVSNSSYYQYGVNYHHQNYYLDPTPASPGGEYYTTTDPNPDDEPLKIIITIENGCVKKQIEIANGLDTNLIKSVTSIFNEDDVKYDLVYQNGEIPILDGKIRLAETEPFVNSQGEISKMTITFDNDFLNNATDVAIFTVTMHENLHALMFYQLDKMEITVDDPNLDFSIMAEEWSKAIANRKSNGTLGTSQIEWLQHEAISNLVSEMAVQIEAFAKRKGFAITKTHAEAIAWMGLDGTTAWNKVDASLKETYKNLVNYEITGFEILAVGKKCN